MFISCLLFKLSLSNLPDEDSSSFPVSVIQDFTYSNEFFHQNSMLYAVSKIEKVNKSYSLLLILLSGDININPGPVSIKTKCNSCYRTVAKNHRAVSCDLCLKWCHIKCEGISPTRYREMVNENDNNNLSFVCSPCHLNNLPYPEGILNTNPTINIDCNIPDLPDIYNDIKDLKGLKMGHLNINGLYSKMAHLIGK